MYFLTGVLRELCHSESASINLFLQLKLEEQRVIDSRDCSGFPMLGKEIKLSLQEIKN